MRSLVALVQGRKRSCMKVRDTTRQHMAAPDFPLAICGQVHLRMAGIGSTLHVADPTGTADTGAFETASGA